MSEDDSHGVYRRSVAMLIIGGHRVANITTSAKISTTTHKKNLR